MTEYTVNIDTIMKMADYSYAVANRYAGVISKIADVDAAVGHLTDKDGAATAADTDVIALVDEFVEYLKTTSSRYHIAADQLVASADTYTATEDDQRAVFDRYMTDLANNAEDVANRDYSNADWNPEEEADQTGRQEGTTEHADGFSTEQHAATGSADDYLSNLENGEN